MSESAISLKGVSKNFRKQAVRREYTTLKSEFVRWLKREKLPDNPATVLPVLKGVDLEIPKGKTIGLVGRNGSGKSTLLKLMTGIYSPTTGTVDVRGRVSALLDLGAGFHPDFTGRENIFINAIILGMSRAEVKERIEEIIAFAEISEFIDQPVRTYSSGMFMRLAFSVATHVDPEILIVDEILAVGDAHFTRKSLARMKEFKSSGRTIVLVTHDLGTVKEWCDHAVWVDGGRIRQVGEPAEVIAQYQEAMRLAEEESVATGHSALSAPGIPLPEVPAPTAPRARVRAVRREGSPAPLPPGARVEVTVELELAADAGAPVVKLGVLRDGALIFEAASPSSPSEGTATLQLVIDALTLLPGTYGVRVTVVQGEEVLAEGELPGGLVMEGAPRPGVVQFPHRWVVPERQARAG